MTDYLSVFTSPQGEVEILRAYQAVLDQWPVPFTELDVPTRFGEIHVIASGPEGAPAVVLLHAYFATAASWYRTVGALSQQYRTYAVDVLGEANKSRPTHPITSLDDARCVGIMQATDAASLAYNPTDTTEQTLVALWLAAGK